MKNSHRRWLVLVLVLVLGLIPGIIVEKTRSNTVEQKFANSLIEKVYDATGILYAVNPVSGRTARLCTGWNVAKVADGYEVVVASHCVTVEDKVPNADLEFSFTYSSPTGNKSTDLVPARVIAFGDDNSIKDVALLDVKTDKKLPVLPLANSDDVAVGESVLNVSIPFDGIDKGLYLGYVVAPKVISNVPEINDAVHTVIFGTGEGSSGSAVVSEKTKSVIGIIIISSDQNGELLVPSNVIRTFMAAHPEKTTPRIVPSLHPKIDSSEDDE